MIEAFGVVGTIIIAFIGILILFLIIAGNSHEDNSDYKRKTQIVREITDHSMAGTSSENSNNISRKMSEKEILDYAAVCVANMEHDDEMRQYEESFINSDSDNEQ